MGFQACNLFLIATTAATAFVCMLNISRAHMMKQIVETFPVLTELRHATLLLWCIA